jgi:hypothetical protein
MKLDTFLRDHVAPSRQQNTFFHFTDTRNLPLIKKHGILSRRRLKEKGLKIPAPGGNDVSIRAADDAGLDRYVSLCLKTGHPMVGAAQSAGTIEDVTYLKVRPEIIKLRGVMMTDGISNKTGIVPAAPGEVLDKLDTEVIYQRTDWRDPEILKRLQVAEKFEILVPDEVPLEYILDF